MKRKGFTLVELLAVIAILAILVLIALPNIMKLFNQAKQSSFENEIKEIFKLSQQAWMKDSLFETKNIVYSRCDGGCTNELELNGRKNLHYYVEVDKGGKIIKLFATDGTYQYEYKGKGLKIDQISDSKQIAKLENSDVIKIISNKIERNGIDITNIQAKIPVTDKIYWALQDNDGDTINETLVISNSSIPGNKSGSFDGNKTFASQIDIPWVKTNDFRTNSNLSLKVSTLKVEGEVAPTSTVNWFRAVGYGSNTFNADLSNLNVSNVTNMSNMFWDSAFYSKTWNINGISNWNTSNVTNMDHMFYFAGNQTRIFNLNLSNWDTSKVTSMIKMFAFAGDSLGAFHLDLSNWDFSKVKNINYMLQKAGNRASDWKISIPKNNGNGINNTTARIYGKDSNVYEDANNSKSGRTFILAG